MPTEGVDRFHRGRLRRDGKIEEEWELVDTMSLLRQVGALPEMAEA
jgi:hypothetical protein